jgi:hypothetical protein
VDAHPRAARDFFSLQKKSAFTHNVTSPDSDHGAGMVDANHAWLYTGDA